jgi:carboxypeptidase Q
MISPYLKSLTLAALSTFTLSHSSFSQYTKQDSIIVSQIGQHILTKSRAYTDLYGLCKKIGNRLSGSPQAELAVNWSKKLMQRYGADTVWLQPVKVPVWKRGIETLSLQWDNEFVDVPMLSLGNTEGTNGEALIADIIEFTSLKALEAASEKVIKGKFVFLNVPFPKDVYNTFDGYSQIAKNRSAGITIASQKGAVGFILRSISTSKYDIPHTGASHYKDDVKKIPGVAIGTQTADKLSNILQNKTIKAKLISNCKMEKEVLSYNVIGEIKGQKYPQSYITVGGHLDSWDVGEGAHDDGVGCMHAIQVLNTFKQLKIKPNNTIRIVMFMNEENGMKGGLAYADSIIARKEQHVFALESDAGGFSPRGIGLIVPNTQRQQAISWMPLLKQFGLYDFTLEGCGVDISPLLKQNIKVGELLPDNQRYFDFHHNQHDIWENVNEREMLLGAAGITSFIYLVDQYWK